MNTIKKYTYIIGEVAYHRLAMKTFEEYMWDGNEIAKIVIEDVCEKSEWKKGLGLIGFVGTGKTHLLIALYKERMWRAVNENSDIPVWLSFQDALELYKDKEQLWEVLNRGKILFIDDLFCMGYGDIEGSLIRDIVLRCYDTNKILCFTTNILTDNWNVDIRIKDRMKEMCISVDICGESKRN